MSKYEFGLRGHDIADNFDDMCRLAKENNIKKLQFALAKTVSDLNFDVVGYDEKVADRVKSGLDTCGLDVSVLGCYINPVDVDMEARSIQLKRFENFIRYAKKFNAGGIGTETGSNGSVATTRTEENYGELLKSMIPLIEFAESEDVNVYIEPVWCFTIYSPQIMKRMIDDLKSDNLKVIFDVSNLINENNIEMQQTFINDAFDLLGDKIRVIHLKDFGIENDRKVFKHAGSGLLDTELLFKRIKEVGTNPDIILDETPLGGYKAACEKINNVLK